MESLKTITFDVTETLMLACFVLLLGYFLVKRIKVLAHYNIPEPVVGGFLVALVITGLHQWGGVSFDFSSDLRSTMMLFFFTCIGLSANFSRLLKGGKPLVIFLLVAFSLIVLQNTFGVVLAKTLGLSPAYGLIAGSIALTGGHGTGVAWAEPLTEKFGIQGAMELSMACATFGLVFGGLIGGPVARYLLKKNNQQSIEQDAETNEVEELFEKPIFKRKINTRSLVETLSMVSVCIFAGKYMDTFTANTIFALPTFVWCLFAATLLRNVLTLFFNYNVAEESIDVVGDLGLSLFLAIALMSLKLWELVGLAGPIFIILALQVLIMILFAIFVTYRFMGKDYDAIVLSAGHCGFGLGATPTAVANMQAITAHFGPSHKAFLIVPMVGAFFIDLMNSFVLKIFTEILMYFQ